MSKQNVIKLSVAGAVLVLAIVLVVMFLTPPRVAVNEEAEVPEMGEVGNTRGPSEDY